MKINRFFFFILSLLLMGHQSAAQLRTVLKGEVINRDSHRLILIRRTMSLLSENKTVIEIKNNHFEYELNAPNMEAYELIFEDEYEKGAWRPTIIFPDSSVVTVVLYDQEHARENQVEGGPVNQAYYTADREQRIRFDAAYQALQAEARKLNETNRFYSKAFESITEEIKKTKSGIEAEPWYEKRNQLEKTGNDLTVEGQQWRARYDSVNREKNQWKYEYWKRNISIAGYYRLYMDVVYEAKSNRHLAILCDSLFKQYSRVFPDHYYTKLIREGLNGALKIYPGNNFIDFTAPDLKGKPYTLSEFIKNKVALINLWGSWCGPCIAKTRKVVPLYKKYKAKGFTVVGVAREYKSVNALIRRLQQEKFDWLNLVELDDKAGIWNKYSVSNGAGIQILVDAQGKILAVDPTAEELAQLLSKIFEVQS